jgi:hypothetical protein
MPLPVRGRPCAASAAPDVGPGVVTPGPLVVVVSCVTVVGDTSVVVVVGADVEVLVDVDVLVEVVVPGHTWLRLNEVSSPVTVAVPESSM